MRSPTLAELPPPPSGKTGWPWTQDSPSPSRRPLPATVVTPSFNQGSFIEETIRSVLLQAHPDLDYLVVDGGSTDGTLEVLRKYESWLSWTSEKDRGQADAINKGFQKAKGEVLAWLNSDDAYFPGALNQATAYLAAHPETSVVYGPVQVIDAEGKNIWLERASSFEPRKALLVNPVPQQGAFIRATALRDVGRLRDGLHYGLDYELWLRLGTRHRMDCVKNVWAVSRWHAGAKTATMQPTRWEETLVILDALSRVPEWTHHAVDIETARIHAHWKASVAYWKSGDLAQAAAHVERGACRPQIAASLPFVQYMTFAYAAGRPDRVPRLSPEDSDRILAYFDLVPPSVRSKARRRARAWIEVQRARQDEATFLSRIGHSVRAALLSPGLLTRLAVRKLRR